MTVVDRGDRAIQRLPFLTRFESGWLAERVARRGGRWRYMATSALCFRAELGRCLFPIPEAAFRRNADAMVVTLLPWLTCVAALDGSLSSYRVHDANCIGGGARDRATAQTVIDWDVQTTNAVNQRLAELGHAGRLDVTRNLEYLQAVYIRALFDGTSALAAFRQYAQLASSLWADDLYRLSQKIMGTFVYGTALFMPGALRAWWIAHTLGFSRLKSRLQRGVNRVTKVFGSSRRAAVSSVAPAVLPTRVAAHGTGV
jgi:hypothetical protein